MATTKTTTRKAPANAKGMTGKSARKVATTKATEQAKARKTKAPAKAKEPKARGLQGIVTITDPKFVYGAEGTVRRLSWEALAKLPANGRTLAAYKAAGGRTKYLKRWEAAGAITIKAA